MQLWRGLEIDGNRSLTNRRNMVGTKTDSLGSTDFIFSIYTLFLKYVTSEIKVCLVFEKDAVL